MVHCCVPRCANNRFKSGKDGKLSFFHFPKCTRVKKEWLIKIKRDEGRLFKVTNHTVVCSAHFTLDCFKHRLPGARRDLKPDAVPTLFDWSSPKKTRRTIFRHAKEVSSSTAGGFAESTDTERTLTAEEACPESDVPAESMATHDAVYGPHLPTTLQLLQLLNTANMELTATRQKLSISTFGLERFSTDSRKLMFYSGFKCYQLLVKFFEWLKPVASSMIYPYYKKTGLALVHRQRVLVLIDEFFLVLCRLHAGLLVEDLAERFNVSVSTCSRIVIAWVNLLYVVLGSVNIWPSRECVDKHMPLQMKDKFSSVRVIVDCTEIFVQKPSSLVGNSQFFSSYKNHTTFKGLLGIAPHGAVTFVSSLYSGCISDVELTKVCGLLELLEGGDAVMADKGFTIQKLLAERHCKLVIPHFLSSHGQFSAEQVADNDAITACRVHVERAIRRIKENRILQGILPLSLLGSANQIWTVCCLLSNFRSRLF